jgi:hypothetical protein
VPYWARFAHHPGASVGTSEMKLEGAVGPAGVRAKA